MEEEGGQQGFVALLLRDLRPDGPRVPPGTWESVEAESGPATAVATSATSGSTNAAGSLTMQPSEPFAVSEVMFVRLILNALQGVKSALDEIEQVSAEFSSTSADRTTHQIPSLWHWSSSMNSLGRLLKSISRSGFICFLLQKFVGYFLGMEQSLYQNKSAGTKIPVCYQSEKEIPKPDSQEFDKDDLGASPPYTLVNQAFAVALGKVLEGYLCSLNTVFASVKCRRSWKTGNVVSVLSAVTLLEIYLHTKELRTHIEAVGCICGLTIDDVSPSDFSGEALPAHIKLKFDSFPRGADLLSYLYVQLRDADLMCHSLLKFLFLRSCEPYCHFIWSWIYEARTNDPYKEFIVEYADLVSDLYGTSSNFLKGRGYTPIPCFLEHVCPALLRTGYQLQVLVKLLNSCNLSLTNGHSCHHVATSHNLTSLEDLLPHWRNSPTDSVPCLSLLTFSNSDAEAIIKKRESIYRMLYAKLQFFFERLDVKYEPTNQMGIPDGLVSFGSDHRDNVDGLNSPITDDSLGFSGQSIDGVPCGNVDLEDTDASSNTDESSYDLDLQQTDGSTLTSCEVSGELEEFSHLYSIDIEENDFPASVLSTCYGSESMFKCTNGKENSWLSVISWRKPELAPKRCVQADSEKCSSVQNAGRASNQFSDSLQFDHLKGEIACSLYEDAPSTMPWPLGGLSENPFSADRGTKNEQFVPMSVREDMLRYEAENFNAVKPCVLYNFDLEEVKEGASSPNNHRISSKDLHGQSWNLQSKYDLGANPLLKTSFWLHNFRSDNKSFLPYFDFSLMENPCEVFSERLTTQYDHKFHGERHIPSSSTLRDVNEHTNNDVMVSQADGSAIYSSSTSPRPRKSDKGLMLGDLSTESFGGASWEGLLRYSSNDVQSDSSIIGSGLSVTSDLPVEVAIEKCIGHGIMHQYIYISKFTIKLLEEGFDLHEHLLTLRRYHFMQFADWADSFVESLWNHKWSVIDSCNLTSEIQRLLVVALQRSSCESDMHHKKLFVYAKGQGIVPLSLSAIGSFDFIGLGYKANWPISIVVTQEALNVYSEIFNFLLQVRLAVYSLSSLWHSLKALVHSINSMLYSRSQEMKNFNLFLKIRQQVNHFVCTLQQYLQSQLSDITWSRFMHSLKYQVNDVLDLEALHMSYLADAQNVCFLSVDSQDVAKIVKAILQCALDLRSCFIDSKTSVGLGAPALSFLLHQINFPKAQTIKLTFEENIKDLYLCYLKSPKHTEFSICRFWNYLDYNEYCSNSIQGTVYSGFKINKLPSLLQDI